MLCCVCANARNHVYARAEMSDILRQAMHRLVIYTGLIYAMHRCLAAAVGRIYTYMPYNYPHLCIYIRNKTYTLNT